MPTVAAPFQAIIMAAGKGTRMKSAKAKVLHEVLGEPMLAHVIDAALGAGAQRVILVLGHGREQILAWLAQHEARERLVAVFQEEQLGTGHAIACASAYLADEAAPAHTYILSGDVPNLSAQTLSAFAAAAASEAGSTLALMSALVEDAGAYGRVWRDASGRVLGVVEAKDASPEQLKLREINTGTYIIQTAWLKAALEQYMQRPPQNAAGEYYLTDLVAMAAPAAIAWATPRLEETLGVNTRAQLAQAQAFAQRTLNQAWMEQGVTMLDPARAYIGRKVTLEPDVTLYPDVHLQGETHVLSGAVIEPGCVVKDSVIEAEATIKASCYLDHARVGQGSQVGPFAHLRPGAELGQDCKVGNFVEIKKSKLEDGAKASHLTYLGDALVGKGANIGAGTITCNYDGVNKHKTTIGAGAFIGSNTALVAPVSVGERAFVAAGSTITTSIPDGALGVARERQRNIEGWAARAAPKKRKAPQEG